MPRFRDQALCLRESDWSESSQIVVVLTETRGKVRGLAKGSKRLSPSDVQRFSGGIELLTRGEILATTRPSAELATLTEWDLQDDFPRLRRDLAAQRTAMYAADLANALLAEMDPHPGSFAALRELLETLGSRPGSQAVDAKRHAASTDRPYNPPPTATSPSPALLRYQWALLTDCGYKPQLTADVHSGEALPPRQTYTFDPLGGGLTLDAGATGLADWRVRASTVELLHALDRGDPPPQTPTESIARANRLLCVYARALLDKQLPTMAWILEG